MMVKSREAIAKKKHSKAYKKETAFILLMLAIPFLNFLVFWLYPNFRSITIAFEVPSIECITLYNFERFFSELFSDVQALKCGG